MHVGPGRDDALVDTPDGVVVRGATPGAEVTLEAYVECGALTWTCRGVFTAGPDGGVDTATAPSTAGDYLGVDPYGLVWSADPSDRPDKALLDPIRVHVAATCGADRAEASYERAWVTPDVTVAPVDEDGVVGRLHLPGGADLPAVVVVGGSDGGLGGPTTAALLSGHGVAALSLAYWNHSGTPPALRDIDVEVVGRACDWLRSRPGPGRARRLSRGRPRLLGATGIRRPAGLHTPRQRVVPHPRRHPRRQQPGARRRVASGAGPARQVSQRRRLVNFRHGDRYCSSRAVTG